jgi:hypothetical protein
VYDERLVSGSITKARRSRKMNQALNCSGKPHLLLLVWVMLATAVEVNWRCVYFGERVDHFRLSSLSSLWGFET